MSESQTTANDLPEWLRDQALYLALPRLREAAAEIGRLRAALEWLDAKGGLGLAVHERICAALGKPRGY